MPAVGHFADRSFGPGDRRSGEPSRSTRARAGPPPLDRTEVAARDAVAMAAVAMAAVPVRGAAAQFIENGHALAQSTLFRRRAPDPARRPLRQLTRRGRSPLIRPARTRRRGRLEPRA